MDARCGERPGRGAVAVERLDARLLLLFLALDELFGAQLQVVWWAAEHVEGLGALAGEHPDHVVVGGAAGGERQLEPCGLPSQRLGVQPDVGVGAARCLVEPGVAWALALRFVPGVVGFRGAPGAQQQLGDQRLRAGMVVELAVEARGERLAHRVDRVVEAAELLVGVSELVEVLGAVRLRFGQLDRARDQAHARVVVVTLAGHIELAVDRLKVSHAPNASPGA